MSDVGQLVSPYQVVGPARGDFGDLISFIQQRMLTDQAMRKDTVDTNTRGMLNDQMGWGNVDPFGVQKFNADELDQRIAGGTYDMQRTNFDQTQDFARNFIQGAQQSPELQNDPYARVLLQSGVNPLAAQGLSGVMQGQSQFGLEQTLNKSKEESALARAQMENDAYLKRTQMELAQRGQAMRDELNFKKDFAQGERNNTIGAIQSFMQNGDLSQAIAAGVPTDQLEILNNQRAQRLSEEEARVNKEKEQSEIQRSRDRMLSGQNTSNPSDNYSPEQKQQIALAEFKRAIQVPTNNIEEFTRVAAEMALRNPGIVEKGRTAFGSNFDEIYQQLLQQKQQEAQAQAYQGDLDKASNPFSHYIKKFLDSALPQ